MSGSANSKVPGLQLTEAVGISARTDASLPGAAKLKRRDAR
jgi:hypothetical protein